MAELGVGTRVWVGWVPVDAPVGTDPRGETGVITSGPFKPGVTYRRTEDGKLIRGVETRWNVLLDKGEEINIIERLLYPIDDGDPVTTEESEFAEA